MNESFVLQMLLGGGLGARAWLEVSLTVCLFAVLIFRPNHILRLKWFKRAYLFLALSVMAPGLATLLITPFGGSSPFAPRELAPIYTMMSASGPLFLGLSVLCGFAALVPKFIPPPGMDAAFTIQPSGTEPPWLRDDQKREGSGAPEKPWSRPEA